METKQTWTIYGGFARVAGWRSLRDKEFDQNMSNMSYRSKIERCLDLNVNIFLS